MKPLYLQFHVFMVRSEINPLQIWGNICIPSFYSLLGENVKLTWTKRHQGFKKLLLLLFCEFSNFIRVMLLFWDVIVLIFPINHLELWRGGIIDASNIRV